MPTETCERAYIAYNNAGDPATAGLNYRGEPCPTWNELPENIRVKWRAATNAVVMDVKDAFQAAEAEVARVGATLEANLAEIEALRGGILHFQGQLIAAQDWILDNNIGLQPVQAQVVVQSTVAEEESEEPEEPGILPRIFRLLDHDPDMGPWPWGRRLLDGNGLVTTLLADAQRVVQLVADDRYIYSTRSAGGEWNPPTWHTVVPSEADGRLPVTLEDLRATARAAYADGRSVHPALERVARDDASSDGGSYGDYP